jgi:hypothetical protein
MTDLESSLQMRLLLAIAILTAGCGSAHADTSAQFDLECNGVTRPASDNLDKTSPTEAWHRTISVDLNRSLAFIHGGTSVTSVIATPDQLIVAPGQFQIEINRSTGEFTQLFELP